MTLQDLLLENHIDLNRTLIFRHRPREPELCKVFPWLAVERPSVFNAYQRAQGVRVEDAMTRAKYVVSFIGREPGKAIFVGLYRANGWRRLSRRQFWSIRANAELKTFGMKGPLEESLRSSLLWFNLALTDFRTRWKGKLVVDWPGADRAWWRWADKVKNKMPVHAILEDSTLDAAMPKWDAMDFRWEELHVLPSRWRAALAQWRGIYYIFDTSVRKGYVGAAYGRDNLLGRWFDYAKRGHGGNQLLERRDPRNFRFSILERVAPDMSVHDITHLEASWKRRLHTRAPNGLNDN